MTTKRKLAEAAGWYGAGAIVAAYALVSFDILASNGLIFQILNLTGALGLIVISSVKKVRQTVVLNSFWAIIAVSALIRLLIK